MALLAPRRHPPLRHLRSLAIALAAAAAFAAGPASSGARDLTVEDAWIRVPPPGTATTAAYLTLKNRGARPATVKRVAIAGARATEIHATVAGANGSMSMKQLPELQVLPSATTTLAPGGMHLMVFDLAPPPAAGTIVELTLTLADGRTIKTPLRARAQ